MIRKPVAALLALGLLMPVPVIAAETVTYTYDARGRLVKTVHTGTVNNNTQTCYKLDKADNRANVKKTVGSLPACPA